MTLYLQFFKNPAVVSLDRIHRQEKPFADFLIREPLCDELQYFQFTRAEKFCYRFRILDLRSRKSREELIGIGENRRLTGLEQEIGAYAILDWEEKVKECVTDLQAGIEEFSNAIPKPPEEQHRVFLLKKQLVDELVAKAIIDGKRDIQVEFRAKIMDRVVSKQLRDFPKNAEIVVRL